jgi:nitrite reductase/ring-hydroxylating ferredoxin subunit
MTIAQPQTSERRIVEVGGRSIGVLNVHGQSYARRNRCPH